jgi:hypothetical protein
LFYSQVVVAAVRFGQSVTEAGRGASQKVAQEAEALRAVSNFIEDSAGCLIVIYEAGGDHLRPLHRAVGHSDVVVVVPEAAFVSGHAFIAARVHDSVTCRANCQYWSFRVKERLDTNANRLGC